jgi:hypothetical protein
MSGDATTICDACADEVAVDECQAGPAGSEWDGANVCNDCYAQHDHSGRVQVGPTDI